MYVPSFVFRLQAFLSDTTGNVMAGGGGIGGPSRQQRLRSADDIAVDVERDSSTFRQVLKARLQQMRIISAHWMQGDFPRAIGEKAAVAATCFVPVQYWPCI